MIQSFAGLLFMLLLEVMAMQPVSSYSQTECYTDRMLLKRKNACQNFYYTINQFQAIPVYGCRLCCMLYIIKIIKNNSVKKYTVQYYPSVSSCVKIHFGIPRSLFILKGLSIYLYHQLVTCIKLLDGTVVKSGYSQPSD